MTALKIIGSRGSIHSSIWWVAVMEWQELSQAPSTIDYACIASQTRKIQHGNDFQADSFGWPTKLKNRIKYPLVISLSYNKKAEGVWREHTWLILHLNHCTKRADSNCLLRMAPVSGLKLSYGLRSTAGMLCCTHFRSNLLKEQEEKWSNKNLVCRRRLFNEHIEVEMNKKYISSNNDYVNILDGP